MTGIKLAVAGSARIIDYSVTYECIKRTGLKVRQIVTGGLTRGIDELAREYAHEYHASVKTFKVYNDLQGRPDYEQRDRRMADYSDQLVVLWDGTQDPILDSLICQFRHLNKPITAYNLPPLHI